MLGAIKSRMGAYEWADANGFKYVRSRIGFGIYEHATEALVFEIGDYHCAMYRKGKADKASRLTAKRTYDQR